MSILHQFIQETEMAAEIAENVVSFREARAKRIRRLAQQWADNTLQLGKELREVRDSFPTRSGRGAVAEERPGWSEWCDENLDFGATHAQRLIRIADVFGGAGVPVPKGSARLLEFLARDTTPEAVRLEVVDRQSRGENIDSVTAKKIAARHAAPKPAEARQIARETGKPTQASDGNIYLGATKEQEKEAEERRRVVYDVRRAVETFAGIDMTAEDFLAFALPHQLWNKSEEHQLQQAYNWMTDLIAAWEQR